MTPDEMRRAAEWLDSAAEPLQHVRLPDGACAAGEPRTLARLLREQAEASGWQPIETAPRDGTEILCWDGRSRAICAYREGKWNVVHDAESDLWPRYEPTQWRTLPPPPEGGK